MRNSDIKALYYITHIDNLPSIFEKGILSHERIEDDQMQPERVYNTEIVNIRKEKRTPNGRSLWSYANLYFQPRNPMMYRVVHEKRVRDLAVLKREGSLDEELADHGSELRTPNAVKWFLLFATKRKWRENSRLEDIEGGLDWVQHHFQKEEIKSLAMPALGCGLGGLDWKDVGPLMCKYLHGIGIPVAIYLPREGAISPEHLTEAHLLTSQ